jgi:hypothetical protein
VRADASLASSATMMSAGDVAARMSSAIGMRPCGGCKRRAAAMNRWLVFSGRSDRHGTGRKQRGGARS